MKNRNNHHKMSLTKAIDASLKNGDRLLNDAELLLYPDSAPTAFVLSVLAQEEFAKAFLLHLVETNCIPWNNDIKRVLNDHSCKQLVGLILDFLNPDTDVFLERMDLKNIGKKRPLLPPHILDALNVIRHEKVAKNSRSDWIDPAEAPCDPTVKKIADGDFDKLKQDAIYVRIARTGAVVSEPTRISPELAEIEFEKAKRFRGLQGPMGLDYEKVTAIFKVLFSLITVEEFNKNWWQ